MWCLAVTLLCGLISVHSVVVNQDNSTIIISQQTANFGPQSYNITNTLTPAQPILGCQPPIYTYNQSIVLVQRGNCTFSSKVYYAQQAGASAVIVGDSYTDSSNYIIMAMSDSLKPSNIFIPSVFVLKGDFERLLRLQGTLGTLDARGELGDSEKYMRYASALKILSVVLMVLPTIWCFLAAMLIIRRMALNHQMRNRRRFRLEHIPTVVYSGDLVGLRDDPNGLINSACAICLDEFDEGMHIKRLECSHAFHSTCIDPWLEQRSDLCPICKRSILQGHVEEDDQIRRNQLWLCTRDRLRRWLCCCLSSGRNEQYHQIPENQDGLQLPQTT